MRLFYYSDLNIKISLTGLFVVLICSFVLTLSTGDCSAFSLKKENQLNCQRTSEFNKSKFTYLIVDKYRSKKHHNTGRLKLKEPIGDSITLDRWLFFEKNKSYDSIDIGDNIFKYESDSTLYIIKNKRNDTIKIVTYFGCKKIEPAPLPLVYD